MQSGVAAGNNVKVVKFGDTRSVASRVVPEAWVMGPSQGSPPFCLGSGVLVPHPEQEHKLSSGFESRSSSERSVPRSSCSVVLEHCSPSI